MARPVQAKFVSKLFWPLQCPTEESGLILGWNIRNFVACVATIVPNVELQVLEDALAVMARDPDLEDLWAHTAGPPIVLGRWVSTAVSDEHLAILEARKRIANFWITLQECGVASKHPSLVDVRLPVLKSVYCCGFHYRTTSQIIVYRRPKAASFLSDQPFSFDWSKFWSRPAPSPTNGQTNGDSIPDSTGLHGNSTTDLQFVLRQINSASKVTSVLDKVLRSSNPPLMVAKAVTFTSSLDENEEAELYSADNESTIRRRRVGSAEPGTDSKSRDRRRKMSQSASLVWRRASKKQMPTFFSLSGSCRGICRFLMHFVHGLLLLIRCLLATVSLIINHRVPSLIGGGLVKDRSLLLQQLDRRMEQLSRWPFMWLRTHKCSQNDAFSNASFMCFWSSISQCVVDVLSGIVVGLFLRTYSSVILMQLHQAGQLLHVDVLRRQVIWLMGLPAGMKLNVNLDQTLGSMVLYGIDFWNAITTILTPLEPFIVRCVSFVGLFGMSMVIACAADLLSMMTIHVNFVHTAFARLYSLAVTALSALWKLFRGKKRNVLKNRIDSRQYEVDELLLGTILFTLIFFLFPTVGIYYAFFSIVRFLITSVQAFLCFAIRFYNHFPFFAVGVFALDRGRLPGGLQIEAVRPESPRTLSDDLDGAANLAGRSRNIYILLHNCDVPFSALFYEFSSAMRNLFKHYSLLEQLRSMILGRRFPAGTPAIEQEASMEYTPGVNDFWFFLKAYCTP